MHFKDKEEHQAWLKERESYHKDFVRPTIELCILLARTDYHRLERYAYDSKLVLLRLGNFWIVDYIVEGEFKEREHFTSREAALFEMDRYMECEDYESMTLCHCGHCNAVFPCGSVAGLCPMCGTDHNGKDFDKYLGWSIWTLPLDAYAVQMYESWKEHLEWRKKNGLFPEWFIEEFENASSSTSEITELSESKDD